MITLISIELLKVFRKWRTYIGFMAIGILVPIVQISLYWEGDDYVNFATSSLKDSFMFVGNLLNGYLIAYLILQALFLHIPFLIVLVGGDLLAGEATSGTYRMLITRPVSRIKVAASKFIAGFIYTNFLLFWLFFMSLIVSLFIFGSGELLVFGRKIYIFAADDVLWRFLMAYGYAVLSMTMVLSLSFFFSSLVENAIGPIVTTMAVIIIFAIISALPIAALADVKPYLFTNYITKWRQFFNDPVEYSEILKGGVILVIHIFGLFGITSYIFYKKDILS